MNEYQETYEKEISLIELMPIPFILGGIIDIQYQGIGCLIAWVIWFIMFILLLMDRQKRESL